MNTVFWPKCLFLSMAFLLPLFAVVTNTGASTIAVNESFQKYKTRETFAEGQAFGSWTSLFSGFGVTRISSIAGNKFLVLKPKASVSPDETHSSLVEGAQHSANMLFQVSTFTSKQLRINTAPNPWEVGWVVWAYTDNAHFYYFVPKPNGWELGKLDPKYPYGQRFLATGSIPSFPINVWKNGNMQWNKIQVVQTASATSTLIKIYANGSLVTSFEDKENPYSAGNIALYDEDSTACFDSAVLINL